MCQMTSHSIHPPPPRDRFWWLTMHTDESEDTTESGQPVKDMLCIQDTCSIFAPPLLRANPLRYRWNPVRVLQRKNRCYTTYLRTTAINHVPGTMSTLSEGEHNNNNVEHKTYWYIAVNRNERGFQRHWGSYSEPKGNSS